MLIKCPECDLQASDKALVCPHCGYPLQSSQKAPKYRKSNRKRRLPNGFGQISEIKGRNLRNPFRAMITVSKTKTGRPICQLLKPVAYFATYNDAYAALVEYNRNPYDVDPGITVKELYEKWTDEYFKTITSPRTTKSAWSYCSSVYDMKVKDVRVRHIKGCMNEGVAVIKGEKRAPSANIKSRIKSMFNMMFDYALEYEIVDQNYARNFCIPDEVVKEKNNVEKEHIAFTDEEIDILWANINNVEWVDAILIQTYSGWRPQEIGLLEISKVDFENWMFTGGMKSEAGTNRTVPIHPIIRDLVKANYDKAIRLHSKYLFNCTDVDRKRSNLKLTYNKYKPRFDKVITELNLNPEHRAHDPRKTFVTKAKKYNVDEYAIKYIVGHVISDITEKVYTEREAGWLTSEMQKIK